MYVVDSVMVREGFRECTWTGIFKWTMSCYSSTLDLYYFSSRWTCIPNSSQLILLPADSWKVWYTRYCIHENNIMQIMSNSVTCPLFIIIITARIYIAKNPSIHSQTLKMSYDVTPSMFLLIMKSVIWFFHDCWLLLRPLHCVSTDKSSLTNDYLRF